MAVLVDIITKEERIDCGVWLINYLELFIADLKRQMEIYTSQFYSTEEYVLNATLSTLQHRIRCVSSFSICLFNDLRLWTSIFFLCQQALTLN